MKKNKFKKIILKVLETNRAPMGIYDILRAISGKTQSICKALTQLLKDKKIKRTSGEDDTFVYSLT